MMTLYTAGTPNGWKASICLEELGLPYEVHPVDLRRGDQKEPWFLALNPVGRIPVLVDEGFPVFESAAILLYLADKTGRLLGDDPRTRSLATQWLMFQTGSLRPFLQETDRLYDTKPERVPWAVHRTQQEGRRLLEVLDTRLGEATWLAGDSYTVADIATWAWSRTARWRGISREGLDHLARWSSAVEARPAVQRGSQVPEPGPYASKCGGGCGTVGAHP